MEALDLSQFCKTKAQATDFIMRLNGITEMIFQTHFDLEKVFMDEFGIQKKDHFMKLLRENQIHTGTKSDLKAFMTTIVEQVSKFPVLSLTVAIEPKEATLRAISEWFILNTHKQVLFDITVDPQIIAGATLNYNGKYKDYSIKTTFEKILLSVVSPKPTPPAAATPAPATAATAPAANQVHQNVDQIHMGR